MEGICSKNSDFFRFLIQMYSTNLQSNSTDTTDDADTLVQWNYSATRLPDDEVAH